MVDGVSPIRVLWLVLLFLVGGCTAVPVEDLRNYDQAFQQVKLAGDLVLDKVAPIVAEDETGEIGGCPVEAGGFRRCFDPLGLLSGGRSNDPPPIVVRRAALRTIADYNAALVAIADGRFTVGNTAQINELIGSAQTLVRLASVSVPGLPSLFGAPATQALGVLVSELQKVRSAIALRRALIAGAPVVQDLLYALALDTPDLYTIYETKKEEELVDARVSGSVDQQRRAIADINAYHDALQHYVTVLNKTSEALDTLSSVAARVRPTTSDIRAIIAKAAEIRTSADAFWRAASASPG